MKKHMDTHRPSSSLLIFLASARTQTSQPNATIYEYLKASNV
jgi:hypothetical protein